MANLRLAPRVTATRAKKRGRRGIRARRRDGGWWEAVKVVFLLERLRRPRSSPSLRQIALVVVSAGLVVVIVRVATHRGKSRAGEATWTPPGSGSDPAVPDIDSAVPDTDSAVPGSDPAVPDTEPATPGSDPAAPANESPLADRVQDEMFHRSDAVHPDA
jgi:hypothetical protein